MSAVAAAESAPSTHHPSEPDDLVGLRVETTRLAVAGLVALSFGILGFAALVLNRIDPGVVGAVVTLWGSSWLAYRTAATTLRLAGGIVVGGVGSVVAGAILLLPGALAAPWLALVVLVASALLGWRWGAAVAGLASALLAVAAHDPPSLLAGSSALDAALLCWASLGASWLISRPTRTALGWAWQSYLQALAQTRLARERQAELVRLSKSLGDSYYQLEQLNLELERARRAAQEARRLKAQFAAAVSHELRTPLNLIIGFCEMMVLSPSSAYGQRLPPNYQDDLEAIYRNACHISALVDDILDLSQIDADRMALHKEWTTLERIVGDAVATVETLFRERDLSLRTELAALPPVYVDQTRVRQILINLLSNAARFVDQGGVTVRAVGDETSVIVSVRDTGPGIPPEELPGVFEEFYQIRGMRRRGGSGLGLTVSKRFAELHGGTMWVESTLGEGSTFYLKLPTRADAPVAASDPVAWDDRIGQRVRGQAERRLVVVDDTGEVAKIFQRYLDGFEIVGAPSLERARKLARVRPVQAVVLGSPAAEEAWRSGFAGAGELARLPIISCVLRTSRRSAAELGVTDYLVKPVTRDQLRRALRAIGPDLHRVLVVDDEPEMTRLLARMVRSLVRGCQVEMVESGEAALACVRERRPDLVILDLLMPGTNGYAVLETLRADATLGAIPVLVVTARGLQDEVVVASALSVTRTGGLTVAEVMRWITAGLDALLPAPFEPRRSAPALPEGSPS